MIEASSKLARFVGLDAYTAAGGTTRADLFGEEVYLEKPALVQRLAEEKLANIRKELEAEGWGWIEINPERDYQSIYRCERLTPMLVGVPAELVEFKTRLDAELEATEQALAETESDALLDRQETLGNQLERGRAKARCLRRFRRRAQNAGRVFRFHRPGRRAVPRQRLGEARTPQATGQVAQGRWQRRRSGRGETEKPDVRIVRRDLAAFRLQVAQVEIARHPAIALDLLAFQAASQWFDSVLPPTDRTFSLSASSRPYRREDIDHCRRFAESD